MILQVIPSETGYRFAKVITPTTGEEEAKEDWYDVTPSRVIVMGTDGTYDFIEHNPDTIEEHERLEACAEYLDPDFETMTVRHPDKAMHCAKVFYGEPDKDGNRATCTLAEYHNKGLPKMDVVQAVRPGTYFKG